MPIHRKESATNYLIFTSQAMVLIKNEAINIFGF